MNAQEHKPVTEALGLSVGDSVPSFTAKDQFDSTYSLANELIFMDAYAIWCDPCKKMAKNVFKQKKVGQFFNQNFINVKMDMEKDIGSTSAKKHGTRIRLTKLSKRNPRKIKHYFS